MTAGPADPGAPAPLILTLLLDAASQAWLQALRDAYFPPERNLVPAHVTLFHALPGAEIGAVRAALSEACAALPGAVPVRIGPPRFLGRGVALEVAAPAIAALRRDLAMRWRGRLTRQDAQGWRPHATVQNKVAPDQARALHANLVATLPVRGATGVGVLLWHYRGGPWEAAGGSISRRRRRRSGRMTSLYLAYGSNLWHAQMQARCPGATLAATLLLPGWRLVVREYALVERDPDALCPVALWRVTPAHMDALDRFEGHPDTYRRDRLVLPGPVDGEAEAWIYHDVSGRQGPPPDEYRRRLAKGYRDCGFDPAPLQAALAPWDA